MYLKLHQIGLHHISVFLYHLKVNSQTNQLVGWFSGNYVALSDPGSMHV